jgi:hypothetical protein
VSEQQAEQSGGENGSLGTGAAVPNATDSLIEKVMASAEEARNIESPKIAPDHDASKVEGPKSEALTPTAELPKVEMTKVEMTTAETTKVEMPKAEPFRVEGLKAEAPKDEETKVDLTKADLSRPEAAKADITKADLTKIEPAKVDGGKADAQRGILIMSPGARAWERNEQTFESRTAEPKREAEAPVNEGPGRLRFAAMAAMLLLAVVAGAAGGAFATMGLTHFNQTVAAALPNPSALEASVARIDADIGALKAGLEQTSKTGLTQFNKTSDRLDRIEKAQSEPAARLARLSEAVDKLRATPPAAAASATAMAAATPKDVTGTVTAPTGAQPLPMPQPSPAAAGTTPKTEVGRLPTIEGWILRDVSHGSALIEGRTGLYEVYAGDPVPGLGRVEAIRRQDGRWVVVTPKGLIVSR